MASDAQVPARTVREYYQVLIDTLLGSMLEPLETSGKRKVVAHGKFFFFDVGVVNALLGSFELSPTHPLLGKCFEHFLFQELRAYLSYRCPRSTLNFWRTQQGSEVDFVIDSSVAIEVKATTLVSERDLKGLALLGGETRLRRKIVVSRDERRRTLGDVEIFPVAQFLSELWAGKIL